MATDAPITGAPFCAPTNEQSSLRMVTLPADTFARVTALQGTAEFLDVLAVVVDHELARIRAHARLFDDRMPASAIADSEAWTYPEVLLNLIRAQADIVMKAVETADLHSRDAA